MHHCTTVPPQEGELNLSALPQHNTLPPPQNASLNVNAQPFVPGETKRCTRSVASFHVLEIAVERQKDPLALPYETRADCQR